MIIHNGCMMSMSDLYMTHTCKTQRTHTQEFRVYITYFMPLPAPALYAAVHDCMIVWLAFLGYVFSLDA